MQSVAIVEASYESLPIFPLPNFTMFPHTMTRLHVFEPRYRMMVAEALATDRLLVLVGLRTGWEKDYYGSPPVHEVGSLCKIVNHERLEDGRYTLFIHCVARVRLMTIHQLTPFRTAAVDVLDDEVVAGPELDETISRLIGCVRGLILHLGARGVELGKVITSTQKPEILTNRLATSLAADPADRQSLLETVDVRERAERLCDHAGDLLLRSAGLDGEFDSVETSQLN